MSLSSATPLTSCSRLRRSRYLFGSVVEGGVLDLASLFQGEIKEVYRRDLYVLSIAARREFHISVRQARILLAVPAERWMTVSDLLGIMPGVEDDVSYLIDQELLIVDDERSIRVEAREGMLDASHWNMVAALYHSMKTWRDVHILDSPRDGQDGFTPEVVDRLIGIEGAPPHHFHSLSRSPGTYTLERPQQETALQRLLARRQSVRSFDVKQQLGAEAFSAVLYHAFGCQGILGVHSRLHLLRKSSPSGGGLHPIEVYPLVRSVQGVPPGTYHYSVEKHALEILEPMDSDSVADLGYVFTAAQQFAREAHVLLVLTARFDRQYWKYRDHVKAYGVLHMDVGHLSQTVYLLCADLGLGACITGAINDANIDERLGLDGITEAALAVIACGVPVPEPEDGDPAFEPYVPYMS